MSKCSFTPIKAGPELGRNGIIKNIGQNAIPRKLGVIEVGDDVEILSKKPLHPALQNAVNNLD